MKNNLPVTKSDLDKAVAKLATKEQLGAVEKRLNDKIDGSEKAVRAGTRLNIDERTKELEEKINLLPTKNEFFTEMDKLMKELQGMREEHVINSYHLKDHEDRIIILEQKTGIAVA